MPSLDDIKAKASIIKAKRGEVYKKLLEFESELEEALRDIPLYAQSSSITLDSVGPDDSIYGYLCWSSGKLAIAYRSTEQDFEDSINNQYEEDKTYSVKSLASSSIEWLELISSKRVLNSLIKSINDKLESIEEQTNNYTIIDEIINTESSIISKKVSEELEKDGDKNLLENWTKARNCIQTDPPDSIAKTCSYIESVCRKIISEKDISQPTQKDVSSLIRVVIDNYDLPEDALANEEIKNLLGNIKGIVGAIGKLRTDFGTAHGDAPGKNKLGADQARLINDIGGAVSSFLLKSITRKT
jgi:hypothetical protein